jgi:CRP-like cAMP-binding protein
VSRKRGPTHGPDRPGSFAGDDDERVALRVEHELFLRSFFELRPPDRMVQQLVSGLRDVFFAAGGELYRQGDAAENLYFLIRGEVALEVDGEEPWLFGPQSMLGVLDASLGRPHSRTARVLRDVAALTMSFREYVDVMEDHFDFTKSSLELGCREMHARSLTLPAELVFDVPAREAEALVALGASPEAQESIDLMERVLVMRRGQVFSRTSVQALVNLAKHVETERWHPGQVLFSAGDPAPHLRLIAAGRIKIERDEPAVTARFGPGELLLRQAALGADVHAYTATAESEAITLRLSKEDLFDVAEDHFSLIGSLFSYLGRENERTRRLLAESARGKGDGKDAIG